MTIPLAHHRHSYDVSDASALSGAAYRLGAGVNVPASNMEKVMDESDENQGEFGLLFAFTDPSESFTNGFEAGMIWQQISDGMTPIEPDFAVHADNAEVLRRMAAAKGYDIELKDFPFGWSRLRMEKRRNRPSVVQGDVE